MPTEADCECSEGSLGAIPSPKWLDVALVQRALRDGGLPEAHVTSLSVRPATAPGDGYVSEMFRAQVQLSSGETRSLVVKCLPRGERFRRLLLDSRTFEAEGEMFGEVVPAAEAAWAATGLISDPLCARLFLRGATPEPFLVLEDLKEQGFVPADRRRGLDAAHARLVLRSLARLHAASAAAIRTRPTLMASVSNFFTQPVRRVFTNGVQSSVRATAARLRAWNDAKRWAPIASALEQRAQQLHDESSEATCRISEGEWSCVLHGDCWTNNMLFRYKSTSTSDETPVDMRFVDLQLSHEGSPAADLLYFFFSSLDDNAEKMREEFIDEYAVMLGDAARELGLQPPTASALRTAMASRGAVALAAALTVRPITRAKTNAVWDVEASLVAEEAVEAVQAEKAEEGPGAEDSNAGHLYADPDYEAWLRRVLPEFMRRGWLTASQ